MSKKYSTWTSNQPLSLMNTNLTMIEGDKQAQCEKLEKVGASADASSSPLTSIKSPLKSQQITVCRFQAPIKDASSTSKRKHKHHRRHHHHHHHHHRRRQVPSKTEQNDANDTNSLTDVHHETASTVDNREEKPDTTNKGSIPLQSIENKLVSQRAASANETQVGNFQSIVCNQSAPSFINMGGVEQIEQLICEDDCCLPSSAISCTSNSCTLPQSSSFACMPQLQHQQQQQQVFLCEEPMSTPSCICRSSTSLQPSIINQMPFSNFLPTGSSSQPLLCVPQTPVQQPTSIIIQQQQQPQIQPQTFQIIQAPPTPPVQYIQIANATSQMQSQPIQIIQIPQTQQAQQVQYVQVSSGAPQIVQAVQASPQVLYQRPYDPIVIPVQHQQLAVPQSPRIGLSHPSYAPRQQTQRGPRMFQHALVRSVANRAGLPMLSMPVNRPQFGQSPRIGSPTRAPLASTGRDPMNMLNQPNCSIM